MKKIQDASKASYTASASITKSAHTAYGRAAVECQIPYSVEFHLYEYSQCVMQKSSDGDKSFKIPWI